jgi:PAS domain S-box-containing protein
MHFEFTIQIIPLVFSILVSLLVMAYAWRHRSTHGAMALGFLSLGIAEWTFMYMLELAGADLQTKLFWGKLEYFGIASVPVLWVVFAYEYANQGKQLTRLVRVLVAAIPAITILLVLTTEWNGLVWHEIYLQQSPGIAALGIVHGPWFWVHLAYSYVMLITGAAIILRSIGRLQGVYRGQAAALIIAVITPLAANAIYIAGLSPFPLLDITPFAFTVSITAVAGGIFSFRLLELAPLARDNFVDEMLEGMIVIDIQGRIADINPAAKEMIGMLGQNVIGRQAREVLSPWQNLLERYWDTLDAIEEISVGDQTDRRWYEIRLSPLYNQQKGLLGRAVTIRNVTAHQQAEEFKHSFLDDMKALQEIHMALSEIDDLDMLYTSMVRLSQQRLGIERLGLFLIDERTNELCGTYGADEDGNTRDERYYREPLLSLQWPWEVLESPNHAKIWENTEIYDNSAVVGIGWKAGATLWNGQKAIGYLASDNFVTKRAIRPYEAELISLLGNTYGHLIERKRADILLQESEARYRQIVESASDVIYRTDRDGRFTYINPVGVHLMGIARQDELLGKHYLETAAPQYRHKLKRFYDHQFVARQRKTYQEFEILTIDGRKVWLGQNVQLIEENGQIVGFQALARDITDLKEAQESLALARDQALEASRLKSQLLAKVSHELRTPLGGVLGYAELLHYGAFGPLDEKQKQATTQIIDSSNYLNSMVNELLDQAQIEAKTLTIHNGRFNLQDMVDSVEANMLPLAAKKGLVLNKTIAPDLPESMRGDTQRLQQILINLVGNAIKFTNAGRVDIDIQRPNQGSWSIQILDTGAGISKEAQSYIFEPFRQVNNAITRENRGTGLGLSITKQLVELMGGEITVQSEVDKGSIFTVVLPILKNTESNE